MIHTVHGINCAAHSTVRGGWWWYGCGDARLIRPHSIDIGMWWHRSILSVSFAEMKILPKSCHATQESCS